MFSLTLLNYFLTWVVQVLFFHRSLIPSRILMIHYSLWVLSYFWDFLPGHWELILEFLTLALLCSYQKMSVEVFQVITRTQSVLLQMVFIFIFLNKFIYLFLAALGLCCCTRAFSSCSEWGLLFVAVCELLTPVASRCGAPRPA